MTPRDKLLATVIPALVVLCVYSFVVRAPKAEAIKAAQKELDQLQSKDRGTPSQERQKLVALAREMETQTRAVEGLRQKWQAAVGRSAAPLCRPERIERLNQLLDRGGLRVIDGIDAESARTSSDPPVMEALAKELGDSCGLPPPRVRVVRFVGKYGDVAKSLRALADGDVLAVPLGLTMKAGGEDETTLEWTLTVWV